MTTDTLLSGALLRTHERGEDVYALVLEDHDDHVVAMLYWRSGDPSIERLRMRKTGALLSMFTRIDGASS